jgi:tetratricopeptide (TPR) repeat protein
MEKGITKDNFNKRFKTCSQHDCPLVPKTIEEISEKMAENRVKKGEEHLARGEFDKAEDKFDRALKFNNENLQALFGLGKAKLELDKEDEAKAIFKLLSEKNSLFEQGNKHTFNDFGIYLRRKEIYDLAIDSYEHAIALDPEDPVLYFNLGKAYAKKGMLQKGVEIIREAIKIYIDFPEAGEYLAELLEEEKKLINQIFTQPDEPERAKE